MTVLLPIAGSRTSVSPIKIYCIEFDFTIDKFRYSIEKDTVTFTDTVTYDGAPKTVSMLSSKFVNRL